MPANRLALKRDLYNIKQTAHNVDRLKETISKYTNDSNKIDEIQKYLNSIAKKVSKKIIDMPLGHEYKGTFYIRKPYTVPTTSIKVVGAAYMREDLVSWSIEAKDESLNLYGYYRDIFKDPDLTQPISREEAKPVFDDET